MAALVDSADVNAWLDSVKSTVGTLEPALLEQVTAQVLGVMAQRYDTEAWTSTTNTPLLAQRIISMLYAGWYYLKIYSTDGENSDYGEMLLRDASTLLESIASGAIGIVGSVSSPANAVASSASIAIELVLSEPKFTMDSEW